MALNGVDFLIGTLQAFFYVGRIYQRIAFSADEDFLKKYGYIESARVAQNDLYKGKRQG